MPQERRNETLGLGCMYVCIGCNDRYRKHGVPFQQAKKKKKKLVQNTGNGAERMTTKNQSARTTITDRSDRCSGRDSQCAPGPWEAEGSSPVVPSLGQDIRYCRQSA
jgi:hypothetical protein